MIEVSDRALAALTWAGDDGGRYDARHLPLLRGLLSANRQPDPDLAMVADSIVVLGAVYLRSQ